MTDALRRRFPWLDAAQEAWLRRALLERAAAGFEQAEHWQDAAACWADLGQPQRAGVLYARAGDRRQAARTLLLAGRYEDALAAYRAWAAALPEHDRQGRIECLLGEAACRRLYPGAGDRAAGERILAEARRLIAEQANHQGPGPYQAARAWAALGEYGGWTGRADLIQQGYELALAAYGAVGAGRERIETARAYLQAVQAQGDRALALGLETRMAEWAPEADADGDPRPPPTFEELAERAKRIRPLRRLEGHTDKILSVAFSPDGRLLATGAHDNSVRLWAAQTGETLRTLEGHTSQVMGVAFSPDGRVLASCSWDDTIRLWAAHTGEPIRTLEGHHRDVNAIALSPDGQVLASASDDNTVRLWDLRTGESMRTLEGHGGWVISVAFSSDGVLLASGSTDHSIRIWNMADGSGLAVLEGHTGDVRGVVFSPFHHSLASCSGDETVGLWDPASSRETHRFEEHTTEVNALVWTPDASVLVSRGCNTGNPRDGEVMFRHAANGQVFHRIPQRNEQGDTWWTTRALAISPDGRLLATYPEDTVQAIQIWDISVLGVGPRVDREILERVDTPDLEPWHSVRAQIERHSFVDDIFDVMHFTHADQYRYLRDLARRSERPDIDAFMRSLAPPGMIYIPPGRFPMGSPESDLDADQDERPQHEVELTGYYIDRCPVTNEAYQRFIVAGGYGNRDLWSTAGWTQRRSYGWEQPRAIGAGTGDASALPVVAISWYEAEAYAHWAGKALPSEAQWEKAASWDAVRRLKRRYPWGDRWDRRHCHIVGHSSAAAVASYSPAGDSAYGVSDLGGNIQEWCSTAWSDDNGHPYAYPYRSTDGREAPTNRGSVVVRGAAWGTAAEAAPLLARCTTRSYAAADFANDRRGFRCVIAL